MPRAWSGRDTHVRLLDPNEFEERQEQERQERIERFARMAEGTPRRPMGAQGLRDEDRHYAEQEDYSPLARYTLRRQQ